MINLDPQQNFTDPRGQHNDLEHHDAGDKKDSYTFYVKTASHDFSKEIELNKNCTIEDAIHTIINLDDPAFKGIAIDDFEVYMANKHGRPKDDFPAFEKHQVLSQANFKRFVIVQRPNKINDDSPLLKVEAVDDDGFEYETVCFCIKLKKKPKQDVYSSLG